MNEIETQWMAVGEFVTKAVTGSGMSLEMFSTKANVSDKTLRRLMRGTPGNYRAENVTRIGKVAGWAPDWLDRILGGESPTVSTLDVDASHLVERLVRAHRHLAQRVAELERIQGVAAGEPLDDDLDFDRAAL